MQEQTAGEIDPTGGAFVINLLTGKDAPAVSANATLAQGKQLYTSMITVAGVEWHRLRLGFYTSEGRAEAALAQLQPDYPDALIVRVDAAEYRIAAANPVKPDAAVEAVRPSAVQTAAAGLGAGRLSELMAEGRREMLAENYPEAIQIYTKVLREGASPYAAEALEYLGLARERNGQTAHAVAEYRRYLAQYPASDDATRVQQRLDGLLLSAPPPSSVVLPGSSSARNERDESRWDFYGGIAQYYARDASDYDDQGVQTTQSAILSDMDMLTRRRGERFDFATRMTFGNYYDLLGEDEGPGNTTRFYYLYADMGDRDLGLNARLGRQTLYTSGVLGRFDGLHLAWQINPDWRINLLGGEPVYSTSNESDMDRSFYGVSVDTFDVADVLDLSFFYNTQSVDGIDDREAVGGELRYYDASRSVISMIDYDIGYNVLNNFVALGNWTLANRLTLNATFDFRRNPYLLTENALVGQGVGTIDELLNMFSEDEVRQLAEDRSGELTTVTLGFSRPLYERFQINADVTMSDFSGTPESTNVAELIGTGIEYYYNLSLVGSSLMKEGDTSIFTVRYLDGETASTTSLSAETRYPITDRFRINPRLLMSYRDFNTSNSSEVLAIPALRLFYQFRRRTRFEFELGGRWSDRDTPAETIGTTSWFLYTGYRTDF
jgi:tetratricopeptide (TPR) repeat protein